MLGRPQHIPNRLRSDSYEDEPLHRGSCQAKYESQHTVDRLRSRVVKTYGNAESYAGHNEDSWEATDGDTEGCNQEGTSARNK